MDQEETIGERLRRLRLARGLSQRGICLGSTIDYSYVSRIEAGTRNPSVRVVRFLARRLRVSEYYLEHGRPDPTRERMWQLVELARFWRARCWFLERRLAEFESKMTADPSTLDETLHAEVRRLQQFGTEVRDESETEVARQGATAS